MFRQNQMYVPDGPPRLNILQHCRDTPMTGHFVVLKTLELASWQYWWPRHRHLV